MLSKNRPFLILVSVDPWPSRDFPRALEAHRPIILYFEQYSAHIQPHKTLRTCGGSPPLQVFS